MARIAFVIPDLSGGGAERVALTLLDRVIARGHEVDLVLMQKRGELVTQVPSSVHLVELGASRIRNVIFPLSRYLRERQPDALQVSMWPLTVASILARALARTPTRLVTSDHSVLSRHYEGQPFALFLLKMTTRLFYPWADARVVVADAAALDLAQLSGLQRQCFDVIYNPVFMPEAIVVSAQAMKAEWAGPGKRVISVGNLKAEKNQALLIRSFARLRQSRAAKLMILGSGNLERELKDLARSLGVAGDVIFAGFVPDPWPYYASADLFVLCSDYEGYPLVLVEAMRSGVPVVATDCESGPREILDSGRFGRLVPVGDEAALANAMQAELEHPTPRAMLVERAEELSGASTVDRYLELLLGESASISVDEQGR
jgi:glycosyltransferase involved in cell wall biosynthesis